MTIRLVLIAMLALLPSRAIAAPTAPDEDQLEPLPTDDTAKPPRKHRKRSPARPQRRYAIASTALIGRNIGGSLYVALDKYAAVRLNAAAYKYQANPAAGVAVAILSHDGYDEENYRKGGFVDGGASLTLFPRRLLDGPTFEIGALVRYRDSYLLDWRDQLSTRESTTIAGRTMVGWSWTIGRQYFVSMAVGASRGFASGRGVTQDRNTYPMESEMPYRIAGWENAFECYTRIGFMFGDAI